MSQDDPVSRRRFLAALGAAGTVLVTRPARAEDAPAPAPAPAPELAPEPPAAPPPAAATAHVPVAFTLDGTPARYDVGADDVALDLIRDRAGKTGCKEACGHGACGACAIQVDGTPVAACLLPATALEGRTVRTVHALGDPAAGALHPVQRAFVAVDAMQCGFCTPGFVVEAAAFHDRWRAEHGTREPSRDQIAAALAGHLCRCGAYPRIYEAVAAACTGAHDAGEAKGPRREALDKVTGKAVYTVDVKVPDALEGRALRSPHAAARLKALDLGPAQAMPGVRAAVALLEVGALARYAGQEVAAVAAVDRHAADAALKAIRVEWEELPSALDPEAAIAPDAPPVFERHKPHPPAHFEGPWMPLPWKGNLRGPFNADVFDKAGRARRRLEEAAAEGRVVELEVTTSGQIHTALEPHAVVVVPEGDGLLVHASTQSCSDLAVDIAEREGLKRDRVRVSCVHVGGGFGAKAVPGTEIRVGLELARAAGAPVRVVWDRNEELTVGGYRPATRSRGRIATSADGVVEALGLHSTTYGGVSVGATVGLMFRILYPEARTDMEDWDVLTNHPPGKPFRGPGGPPGIFALESLVDEVALRRGEDAIALRARWDAGTVREPLYAWGAALPAWKDRAEPDRGRFRRGIGAAAAAWYYLYSPGTEVRLETIGEGRVLASTAAQDVGQGARTVLARATAQALGIDEDRVEVRLGDSRDPHGVGSSGSRTTMSLVPAAEDAAQRLRAELDKIGQRAGIGWEEVLQRGTPVSVLGRRGGEPGPAIPEAADTKVGRGFPGALQVSEVEVDTRLGRVRATKAWLAMAVGRIVVPELATRQCEGAVVQGVGYALYEEQRYCPKTGRLLTAGLEDYRLPGIGDVPEVEIHFLEGGFEHTQGGGTGIAELSTLPCAASIANAVRHATGWRPTALPIRPDRVLAGVKA